MKTPHLLTPYLFLIAFFYTLAFSAQGSMTLVSKLDKDLGQFTKGPHEFIAAGPKGERVVHTNGELLFAFNLKKRGIDPRDFDYICMDMQADARAWLVVSIENYPEPGVRSNWYVLDGCRGRIDWKSSFSDLKTPEERYQVGGWGSIANKNDGMVLQVKAYVQDTKNRKQGMGRSVWLRNLRFVKKSVEIDWDQTKAPYRFNSTGDLVYTYPLTLRNRLDKAVKTRIKLEAFETKHAKAWAHVPEIELKAGESREVAVSVSLHAKALRGLSPLYCERFSVFAETSGQALARTTIIRSSDPIHLTVTVPIDAKKRQFPLLPRRRDLPVELTQYTPKNQKRLLEWADNAKVGDLECMNGPVWPYHYVNRGKGSTTSRKGPETGMRSKAGVDYLNALHACAVLYDYTGEKKYHQKGTAMLLELAEWFQRNLKIYREAPFKVSGHGILFKHTNRLGQACNQWIRPYSVKLNQGYFNHFDLLASDMDPATRDKILRDLIVPSALQCRNHLFGLTNQQDVSNAAILYAGIASGNWPLAAFAYNSEHGFTNQIRWGFDDEGLCTEGHYQVATVMPIHWSAELLYAMGINHYDERLCRIFYSPAAIAINKSYADPKKGGMPFYDKHRFTPEILAKSIVTTDGLHSDTGSTLLMWKGLGVGMNWGTHIFRSARDRCALSFQMRSRKHPLRALNRRIGGGSYNGTTVDQSIIVVDEMHQNPVAAEVQGVDVDGEVQYIQTRSEDHYPGSSVTRTFALVDEHVIVVDRITSAQRRESIDWLLKTKGTQLSLPLNMHRGSFTRKADDPRLGCSYGARKAAHSRAITHGDFRDHGLKMLFLGQRSTEVMTFPVWSNQTMLMVRRRPHRAANSTDMRFEALFSASAKKMSRHPVKLADGKGANALGLRIELKSGKVFDAIVNWEKAGIEVHFGKLKTKARFATNYNSSPKAMALIESSN